MNDPQRQLLAAAVCMVLLAVVFLCPWRVQSTEELRWSPIYQQPLVFVRSYDRAVGAEGGYRIASEEASIAYELLALEVLALGVAGIMGYVLLGSREDEDVSLSPEGPSKNDGDSA
ncbi:MAG: hypothetical protein U5K31_10620 [Balneolaceae bacterium]|nr:hypothetical protein [Balneolaceae bacterium]